MAQKQRWYKTADFPWLKQMERRSLKGEHVRVSTPNGPGWFSQLVYKECGNRVDPSWFETVQVELYNPKPMTVYGREGTCEEYQPREIWVRKKGHGLGLPTWRLINAKNRTIGEPHFTLREARREAKELAKKGRQPGYIAEYRCGDLWSTRPWFV